MVMVVAVVVVGQLTERVATRELGLLGVARLQLVADAVEQLHVALLRVLLEGRDEGPRHGARGLGCDGRVGSVGCRVLENVVKCTGKWGTNEV